MTRRKTLAALMTAPITAAVALAASVHAKVPHADVIRQSELKALLELQRQLEAGAANIRRRAEAGAILEHGELGISTMGYESLAVHEEYGETGNRMRAISDVAGLDIAPVDKIQFHIDLARKYPDRPANWLALI